MSEIEYFYSAHSAFAYLGHKYLMGVAERTGRRIVHRPCFLTPLIDAAGSVPFANRTAGHVEYFFDREIQRWGEQRDAGVMKGMPVNHRGDMTMANCMLIAAQDREPARIDQLALEMLQAHWRDNQDLEDQAVLDTCANAAGIADLDGLKAAARTDTVRQQYEKNTAEAIERHCFGSPTYFVDGDMFYGQDRLELVERACSKPYARW